MATQPKKQRTNFVTGKVTDQAKRPLANLIVRIYDRDMRSEEMLSETITDKKGKYSTTWLHSQLSGRGRKEADISVKVFTKEKKELLFASGTDDIRFNASPKEEINITISK